MCTCTCDGGGGGEGGGKGQQGVFVAKGSNSRSYKLVRWEIGRSFV